MMGIKNIKIFFNSKECSLNALCDTGNLLKDPISDNPVVIAEKSSLESLFPNGVPNCESTNDFHEKIRIIPYSSIGNASAIMTGFVPDKITIEGKDVADVVIGISETSLSHSKEYDALFNPNIINTGRS